MKRLRDAPTSKGRPNRRNSSSRASTIMLCSGVLPKPMPGSSTIWLSAMPARAAMSSERAKNVAISCMISMAGSARSRLCITMTGTLCSATTLAMSGSRCRPQTSLAIAAPASSAHATTADFMLSMETGVPRATTSASTGRSRCNLPRRTPAARHRAGWNSAPMSTMSAPSAIMRRACASALSGAINCPPSEKESGVTLSTPITAGVAATAARAGPDDPPGQVWKWSRSCRRFARSNDLSQGHVSRMRCGILHAARRAGHTKHRCSFRPRLCSAPLRKSYAIARRRRA